MHFVFMGVSGCGKSTVAAHVAERLGLPYAEADQFHPRDNITKMSSGVPLTDDDRQPWLRALAGWIAEHDRRGEATVMACSALKRAYRDVLRTGAPDVRFVHLDAPSGVIAERLRLRSDHFMPAGLLESQEAALERLEPDEAGVTLDVSATVEEVNRRAADIAARALGRAPGARP